MVDDVITINDKDNMYWIEVIGCLLYLTGPIKLLPLVLNVENVVEPNLSS